MLEVSSLRSPSKAAADQRGGFVVGDHHVGFPTSAGTDDDDFMVDDNLLDYIDFSSCCDMPFFDADGDILPDLEVDPTDSLLAEFSSPETSPRPPPDEKQVVAPKSTEAAAQDEVTKKADDDDAEKAAAAAAGGVLLAVARKQEKGDEVTIITEEVEEDSAGAGSSDAKSSSSAAAAGVHISSKKKASSAGKDSNNGKRKVKVDWTPELHRRFVQAVEQLGIDKAVPSRILEIMGIEGLTRHNIASHLQKYRSHRKHLMAREAEAATWAQKRQLYAAAPVARKAVEAAAAAAGPPWVVPTIGFPPPPPPAAMAPHPPPPFCRPLHVWGHPPTTCAAAVEAPAATTMLPLWPRHLAPPRAWVDPGYWHHQQQYNAAGRTKWGPPAAAVTQGTPCVVPPPPAAMVPRFPHPSMYSRPPVNVMVPPPAPPPAPTMMTTTTTTTKLAELQLQLDAHPSKESIDAAIGDVLVKPWLPLPLGLKPPSLDSVMSELHRHGIPTIPPATS